MDHVILHSLLETAKLLPFLFLTYLLMEFLEHRAGGAAERWLHRSGRIGPLLGASLGLLPQCGFSAAASGMYAGRIITTGTLIAVYLSTSDEMLPLLISKGTPFPTVLLLLGIKLVFGIAVGFLIDGVTLLLRKHRRACPTEPQIEELCERERCRCGEHFALSALRHTAQIGLFVLLFTFLIHLVLYFVGEDALAGLLSGSPILGNLLAVLVGLIPNCASSVALTELYLSGILPIGALMSGLFVNAGVGLLVLFRLNRPVKDSLRILCLLLALGFFGGLLVGILF